MQKQSQVIKNYLLLANNFKDANSLTKFIDENLHETSMKDIVIVNKPPGFVLSSILFFFKYLDLNQSIIKNVIPFKCLKKIRAKILII